MLESSGDEFIQEVEELMTLKCIEGGMFALLFLSENNHAHDKMMLCLTLHSMSLLCWLVLCFATHLFGRMGSGHFLIITRAEYEL